MKNFFSQIVKGRTKNTEAKFPVTEEFKETTSSEKIDSEERGDPCLIRSDKLTYVKTLGQGSFGLVSLKQWEKSNGQVIEVAVKELRKEKEEHPNDNTAILHEIQNMHGLNHPNIVKLFGITIYPSSINLVVELCQNGSLRERLRDNEKPVLLVTQLLDYAIQICSGMTYLESMRCVHRDLAARNVLLTNDEKTVKISDFGLSRFLEVGKVSYKMKSNGGIPYPWCPPETMEHKIFSRESDVWAYGVTLWEMFSYGKTPWFECFIDNEFNAIKILGKILYDHEKLKKPAAASKEIYDIMCLCWEVIKEKRPTFAKILSTISQVTFKSAVSQIETSNSFEKSLPLEKNELVIIIDENDPNNLFGQSAKTRKFGYFHSKNVSKKCNVNNETDFKLYVNDAHNTLTTTYLNNQLANKSNVDGNIITRQEIFKNEIENTEKVIFEAWAIGRTSLAVQMEGCNILMYPRLINLEETTFQMFIKSKKIDCCIGRPENDVVHKLKKHNNEIRWVTWHQGTVDDLQNQDIPEGNIYLTNSKNHTLSIRGNNFKFYENQDGYIIKGPTIKMLYLSIEGVQEETKKAINKHKAFEVAFFFMKKLEYTDKIKNAIELVQAKINILLIAKNYDSNEKEKFEQELKSLGILNYIILEKNQGYKHPPIEKKSPRGFFRYSLLTTNWSATSRKSDYIDDKAYMKFTYENEAVVLQEIYGP